MRLRIGVETAGHLDVLRLLIFAECGRGERAVDAIDRARIVALLLQRGLGLTDVIAALGLGRQLILGLAGLVLGLVNPAIDLGTYGVLVLGLLVAADLGLDLVLGLGRLLLRLVPGLGRLLLDGVLGVGRLLLDLVRR